MLDYLPEAVLVFAATLVATLLTFALFSPELLL